MTILQQLKQKIQELRPEIMELKFGCEVIIKTSFNDGTGRRLNLNKTVKMVNEDILSIKDFEQQAHKKIIEILGRPITLEDVLFCCIEAYSKFGIITKKSYEEMFGGVVGLFDFSKDFEHQKEEFYDEIMFLLKE